MAELAPVGLPPPEQGNFFLLFICSFVCFFSGEKCLPNILKSISININTKI